MERKDQICFGKVDDSEEKYFLFHHAYDTGKLFDPGKVLTKISYDYFTGYLGGATFGKPKTEIFLYNGVSTEVRGGYYPNLKFSKLEIAELTKLLEDSGLSKRFSLEDVKDII